MKRQELETLHPGAWLVHSRYGLCELREIIRSLEHPEEIFGMVIRPMVPWGQAQLNEDSGSAIPDFLEDSLRRLSLYQQTASQTTETGVNGHDSLGWGPGLEGRRKMPRQKGLIQGQWATGTVWFDGRVLSPGASQKVRNHSPEGFAWSYNGSGPAQLALALCLKLTDKESAGWLYQTFKREKIATLPAGDFTLSIEECRAWIAAQRLDNGKDGSHAAD